MGWSPTYTGVAVAGCLMIHGKILQLKETCHGICPRRDLDDDAATMSLFTFPDISGMVNLRDSKCILEHQSPAGRHSKFTTRAPASLIISLHKSSHSN